MKRYVIEMLNDYSKKYSECSDEHGDIEKMRNAYISGILTADEIIKSLYQIITK